MSGVITRATNPAWLIEGIKDQTGLDYQTRELKLMQFYRIVDSNKDSEIYQENVPLGDAIEKPEGTNAALDVFVQSGETRIPNTAFFAPVRNHT